MQKKFTWTLNHSYKVHVTKHQRHVIRKRRERKSICGRQNCQQTKNIKLSSHNRVSRWRLRTLDSSSDLDHVPGRRGWRRRDRPVRVDVGWDARSEASAFPDRRQRTWQRYVTLAHVYSLSLSATVRPTRPLDFRPVDSKHVDSDPTQSPINSTS